MKKKNIWFKIFSVVWYISMFALSIIMLAPFIWTIITSLTPNEYMYDPGLIPQEFTLQHYKDVFTTIPFGRYIMNSLFLAFVGVITNLIFGSLAGYAFAKFDFRAKEKIFKILLASMMIPGVVLMIPQFLLLLNFPLAGGNSLTGDGGTGLINTYWAIVLPGAAGAYGIFFMRQFFLDLPSELGEASRIDGLSEFQTFWQIYLPLAKPALSALAILTFQSSWNAFMWPLIVLNSEEMMTVQVGLSTFTYNYSSDVGALMAGSIITIIPTLIIFITCQKYFVEGIAFTGGKQ